MNRKLHLLPSMAVLWLALSSFYNSPPASFSRGVNAFLPNPPPGCDITLSTANGDFPVGQMTQWTVPAGVTEVIITTRGGDGAAYDDSPFAFYPGGTAATAEATFSVTPGHVLHVIVGKSGYYGSGGGGTGIYNATTGEVLIAAGGGGGAHYSNG